MDVNLFPILLFSFLSYLSVAFAGFGGILLPIALGAAFYPIEWMLSILIPVSLISNSYILVRHFRQIDFSVLLRKILPYMSIGLVIGIITFQHLHGEMQERIFGILVILLSLRELIQFWKGNRELQPAGRIKSFFYILSAGVIQGMYGSGAPLLVYVVNKLNLKKSTFRSTLSIVWLTMNIVLTSSYIVTGKVTLETGRTSIMLLPSLVLGLMAGEFLHKRISDRFFKISIYVMLLVSGFIIVFG